MKQLNSFCSTVLNIKEPIYWSFILSIAVLLLMLPPDFRGGRITIQTVVIISCLLSFVILFRYIKFYQAISNTQQYSIRDCPEGYVGVEGKQFPLPDQRLLSPLTKTLCTWFQYTVQKRIGRGEHSTLSTIDEGLSEIPFCIMDNTTKCIIEPTGAIVYYPEEDKWYGDTKSTPCPPKTFMRKYIGSLKSWTHCLSEKLLRPNTNLLVIGMARKENNTLIISNKELPKNRPFILSTRSKNSMVKLYITRMTIYFTLGIVLAILSNQLELLQIRYLEFWSMLYHLFV